MILSSNITVYLKTTETCNLNCQHCFTSGSQGKKIFFDPDKTIHFFERLVQERPHIKSIRYLFHGGEPLLAPIKNLKKVYAGLKGLVPHTNFGMQTNLVFPLTQEKRQFLKDHLYDDGFGTSWDYDIRFGSPFAQNVRFDYYKEKQIKVWENNVQLLIKEDGHFMTMIVSITKKLIREKSPLEILEYARSLGFQNILFERITSDGNAKENSDIIPSNKEQDDWLYLMFQQTFEHKTYEYIYNMFLNELVEGFVNRNHVANRCRTCEKSLLTINADGSIGGCPNTAPTNAWGHIDWTIGDSLGSDKRLKTISCEQFNRNPICYTCEAFAYCNSDCHQLEWDQGETYCAAPKQIWQHMIRENDVQQYKKLMKAYYE